MPLLTAIGQIRSIQRLPSWPRAQNPTKTRQKTSLIRLEVKFRPANQAGLSLVVVVVFSQGREIAQKSHTSPNEELAVVFPNSLVNIYRFVCFCIVCVCSWQRRTPMPTAGCIRAGTAAITLMKESQMEPAGTLYLRVGYILHTTVLIQLLQQGLWFCLI